MITWTCHVCGEDRPDHLIAVHRSDRSAAFGWPAGTIKQNVRYCADRPECRTGAENVSFFAPAPEPGPR